ncbi:MAG: cell division protein ZipA C-terminal FtsZ-binding domain-containing protein [Pseudomonadota bacterium]
MNLQYALLFIGIVIVVVVALTTYDMSRLRRPRSRPEPHLGGLPEELLPVRPGQPDTAREQGSDKVLRTDLEVTLPEKAREDVLRKEIRVLEEMATMPLNLKPGFQRRVRPRAEPGRQYLPDEKIDFVIDLPGAGPVLRDAALSVYRQNEYNLNKPRHLYGRHHGTERWSDLELDPGTTEYDDLKLVIQLTDPRGPIDESELNAFMQIGLKLADALQRPTKLPEAFEAGLARAADLQAFCDTYDVIAGIHVVPAATPSFAGRVIETAARNAGLELGARNLFHRKNEVAPGGRHLFSLANLDETSGFDSAAWDSFVTSGLSLFMSVPCAFQPGVTFDRMVAAARQIADALGGSLQDQNRRPLTDKGIAVIHHQIEEIEEKMRAYGIPPGSETALKLFNEAATP